MTSRTTTITQPIPQTLDKDFQTNQVATIAGGHFVHDTYSAFLAPLLPVLIAKLSMSLTQAGTLSAMIQLPSLVNPLYGYLDDKINLRMLVILAPAITATLMSSVGLAPNYLTLTVLMFVVGLSVAAFHATAPAMVARVSGKQIGKGMSFFMAAGELGRTVGPLFAVWAVSLLTLDFMIPVALLGWVYSLVMYLRFRSVPAHVEKQKDFKAAIPAAKRLFFPMIIVVFARSLLVTGMGVYLPTFIKSEGASLWTAGSTLALYQLAGVGGALAGGTFSDRLGRKPMLFIATSCSPLLVLLFLNIHSWWSIPVLLVLGFISLSAQPVMLAMVQDHLPEHRSVANGLFTAMSFILQSTTAIVVGALGDHLGLQRAFFWAAISGLVASPIVMLLPKPNITSPPGQAAGSPIPGRPKNL
jgi:FSR family fosmidomycin resistance protein-like MFS transporter